MNWDYNFTPMSLHGLFNEDSWFVQAQKQSEEQLNE
jgi:hypothetical protein